MQNRSQRKLLNPHIMHKAYLKRSQGVPFPRIMRDLALTPLIAQPTFRKLMQAYALSQTTPPTPASLQAARALNPPWLLTATTSPIIQLPPPRHHYSGLFPFGEWEVTLP